LSDSQVQLLITLYIRQHLLKMNADYWIKQLRLNAHPEGGYYRETYRSPEDITTSGLPNRFGAARSISTAIYFLLRSTEHSAFHRIKSDEIWHFHAGSALNIYVLHSQGVRTYRLGLDVESGEHPQVVIPASHWFGARVSQGGEYTLSSCTVAPGFDFKDFELGNRPELSASFPACAAIIDALTPP
jgi:predicted cupin superfamily sugar epimerase